MENITLIFDKDLRDYGLLKSIPLIKEKYGVKYFTFMSQYYYIAKNTHNPIFFIEEYQIEYVLLNSSEIKEKLENINCLCQIITQKQENQSKIDITKSLIKYSRENPEFNLIIMTDAIDFKLKEKSMKSRSDRSIIDNFKILKIERYTHILEKYIRRENLKDLRKYYNFTKNFYFLKIAHIFEKIYGKLKNFEEIFNMRHLRELKKNNSRYVLGKFCYLILVEINKRRHKDTFQLDQFLDKILKPIIEVDKLRIKNHLDLYFQSIKNNLTTLKNDFGDLLIEYN